MTKELEVIAHHFIGGVYCKEVVIPEDHFVVSHKHNFDHMSVLITGCVIVEADGVDTIYFAPAIINIKAGVNHSVTAVNDDAHWLCIHATDETDIEKVDQVLIQQQNPHMIKADFTLDVQPLVKEIHDHPELWDQNTMRTTMYEDSPHRDVSDIWLRYNSLKNFDPNNPDKFSNEHESVWYPATVKLPSFEKLLDSLLDNMEKRGIEIELGGVLITKIPPGKQVYPHSDAGKWHADYYDTKILVLLESAPGQTFNFDGQSYSGIAGEVFYFNNAPMHWVVNDSDTDRVSLILATKRKA